ncbi:hypothetical protein GHT06_004508 [Daphnia sinensis]|uniref:RapA2 cadherin-like domain-containing protein n=1 Tax=Daphnia sinensis TaxID=1820382 RepID=A0AAD5KUC2_9CRUS|nr:hypothetical protein GHT06_004508 [Daphnia sinensis]
MLERIVVNADESYVFMPLANYSGEVPDINYTISDGAGGTATSIIDITITPVNDAPAAVNDSKTGAEDATLSGTVLTNDSDIDGGTLSVTSSRLQEAQQLAYSHHTYNLPSRYNSHHSECWNDSCKCRWKLCIYSKCELQWRSSRYKLYYSDGTGGTATSIIDITITPVNDAPAAVNDSKTGAEDATLSGTVLTNDTDIDGAALSVTSFTVAGGTPITVTSGTPDSQTIAEDSPATGNVITNDSDVETANSSLAVTQFSFTVGTITSTFPADGTGGTATSIIDITVSPVNDAPAAVNDSNTGAEDATLSGTVLANDSDIDSGTLSITSFSVAGGTSN